MKMSIGCWSHDQVDRFLKNPLFTFSYRKACYYDGQESQMLHTKFRGNRLAGSGDFLPYMGVAANLLM